MEIELGVTELNAQRQIQINRIKNDFDSIRAFMDNIEIDLHSTDANKQYCAGMISLTFLSKNKDFFENIDEYVNASIEKAVKDCELMAASEDKSKLILID